MNTGKAFNLAYTLNTFKKQKKCHKFFRKINLITDKRKAFFQKKFEKKRVTKI